MGTVGTEEEGTGLGEHLGAAAKAILPLVGVLLVALFVFVREKIPHPDEVVLGVVFSLAGMCIVYFIINFRLMSTTKKTASCRSFHQYVLCIP